MTSQPAPTTTDEFHCAQCGGVLHPDEGQVFLTCPYCLGAWIALAFWGAWYEWPSQTLIVSTPLMLSAGVIGAHKFLSED